MDRIRVIFEGERRWAIGQTDDLSARSARAARSLTLGLAAGMVMIIVLAVLWIPQSREQLARIAKAHRDTEVALLGLRREGDAREESEARVRQLQKMEARGS